MVRKYVNPECDGGIFCPVEGHVTRMSTGSGKWRIGHIKLTPGQLRTIRERRDAIA
jgi:hypothetical protein